MKTQMADASADSATAWKFFYMLKASRLLPADEVEELERRAQVEPLADLHAELLRDNRLTEYQLVRLLDGQPDGLVLGKYRVLRELGEGGFGKVFLAYHTLMHRLVALKMLGDHLRRDAFGAALFRREVVATTRLAHPNIASAFDADECDGRLFLVMQYVDGPTLEAHVSQHGPLSPAFAATVLAQTAAALQHAHQLGFVHRDIKPANIILSGPLPSGDDPGLLTQVKLLDFGLARVPAPNAAGVLGTLPVAAGGTVGTPAYIAPEQIGDPHAADVRSDLYSLGCTLFFALTGRLPFSGDTVAETIRKHLSESPVSVRLLNPAVPPRLADIILVLMAKDPADRLQTPAELLAVLSAPDPPAAPPDRTPHPFDDTAALSARHPQPAPPVPHRVPWCGDAGVGSPTSPATPTPLPPTEPLTTRRGPSVEDLIPLWEEWFTALRAVVRGGEPDLSDEGYHSAYSRLIEAATSIETTAVPPTNGLVQRLIAAVEPWVSLRAITDLDRRMLASVWGACLTIDSELLPATAAKSRGVLRLLLIVALLSAVTLGLWILLG